MRILAVDASTQYTFLVLCTYDDKWTTENLKVEKTDRENDNWLETLIQTFCRDSCGGLQLQDLDGFAAGYGPGSFTGLRINFTYLKTLAILWDKIFLTFSTSRFYHSLFCQADEALLVQANRSLYFSCDPDQSDKVDNIRSLPEWTNHYSPSKDATSLQHDDSSQDLLTGPKRVLLWNQYPSTPNAQNISGVSVSEFPEIDPRHAAPSASIVVEMPTPEYILNNKQEFMNAMPFYGHDVIFNRKL
jgi:tRNA A37 threonylcarbamoyladenosine modification protein TsaB